MDDEEEDMALQPIISQFWDTLPCRTLKMDEVGPGQHRYPAGPRHGDGPPGADHHTQHHGSLAPPFAPPHGNSGLQSHPVPSSPGPHPEPMEDRGDRPAQRGERAVEEEEEEEEKEGGEEEGRGEAAGPVAGGAPSVEVEIGRRLREIGDQFHRDHAELRPQREAMPVLLRLAATLLGLLFPRGPAGPRPRGARR